MNATEFKILCPDKANLTGIDLANAMEDWMLCNATPLPKRPLVDWMGNFVQSGDIVDIYRTRHFLVGEVERHFLNSKKPSELVCVIPDEFIWELYGTYAIYTNADGELVYDIVSGGCKVANILASDLAFGYQNYDVICIRGKSDNPELYLERHPEAKEPRI